MKRSIFSIVLFLLLWGISLAAVLPSFTSFDALQFQHLSKRLSYNTVECIFQDHKGFLWIGTHKGLNRYDGIEIKIYESEPNDSTTLSNDHIRKIAEDQEGNLWIATENGLNVYHRKTDKFRRYFHQPNHPRTLSDNMISDLLVDHQGHIWIASRDLCLYHPESNDFSRYSPLQNSQEDPYLTNYHNFVYEDREGRIWFGHWRTLYIYNKQKQTLKLFFDGNSFPLGNPFWHFQEMTQDSVGTYWFATNQAGLFQFRFPSDPISLPIQRNHLKRYPDAIGENDFLSKYRILGIFVDKKNWLWISIENNGLAVLDPSRKLRYRFKNQPENPHSISGNSVWSMNQDRQGRIWFGLWMAGIDYMDPHEKKIFYFSKKEGLSNEIVTGFLEDTNGNLWIGTDGGGLNYFDRKKGTFTHYAHDPNTPTSLSSNAVLSLCYDDLGNLWIGTWNGGINILPKHKKEFIHLHSTNSPVPSNHIFALANLGKGKMAIGTYGGGLCIYDVYTHQWEIYQHNFQDPQSLQSNNIFVLFLDTQKRLWIGTLSDGLALLEKNPQTGKAHFIRFVHDPTDSHSISDNRIHSLVEDKAHHIWIATSNGLNEYDPVTKQFHIYTKKHGLPSNFIIAISNDHHGNLWISSLGGLARFELETRRFRLYESISAPSEGQFHLNAILHTQKGELYFGTTAGFFMFHPDHIRENPFPPPIVLTDFKIFNQSVPIGKQSILKSHVSEIDQLVLPHWASVFSFDFAALNFTHPEKNLYAYKMEGFETKWNFVGNQHHATYTNLSPGHYIFRIKAANNDGVWNEEGLSLPIYIPPPFWKTWIALSLYGGIALGIFYLIMRYRLRQQKLRHDLEMEHVKFEKLLEADKIKTHFLTNLSHELRTPIMLITGPLEHLLKNHLEPHLKNTIEITLRNAKRLMRILHQFIAFTSIESPEIIFKPVQKDIVQFVHDLYVSFKEYARLQHIDFQFQTNISYGLTWFDPDILDKILYNLLSNAFKFTREKGKIKLHLYHIKEQNEQIITLEVEDTGIGIPKNQLDRIFDPYYQVDQPQKPKFKGLGLGLYITRELAELHQGSISVKSIEGKGTTFSFQFPVDEIILTKPKTLPKERPSLATPEFFHPTGEEPSFSTLLFIDDDSDLHRYIHLVFDPYFKVLSAFDGKEGLEKATALIPDIILSDVEMPEMNGYELCEKIKNNEKTSHIPVLLLTVHSQLAQKIKGIQIGADDYLAKPFEVEELKARVINLLESRKKMREYFVRQLLLEPKDVSLLSLDEKFLLRAKQLVENRLSDWKLNADELSRELGISRTQLYRKLRGLTGQTVHEFIRTIRIKRAAQLLEKQKMKISEIAYTVGFNDLNYFSRCFRKQFGKSPSEYMASLSHQKIAH